MIRGHVILCLYLLTGMLFIVDLYVACVYVNKYFDEFTRKELLEAERREMALMSQHYPGYGIDYGFDHQEAPPESFKFGYKLTPRENSVGLTISAPLDEIISANIDYPAIYHYTTLRIFDFYNFKQYRGGVRYKVDNELLRITSIKNGSMWIKKEVAESMQAKFVPMPSVQLITFKKRKRSLLPDFPDYESGAFNPSEEFHHPFDNNINYKLSLSHSSL